MSKRYEVKVLDKTGTTYKGTYPDLSSYSFTKTINGGLGPLSVLLPRPFDNFGEGGDIDFCYEVEVWVSDGDAPSGVQIYSGYISSYSPFIKGQQQGVSLVALGYVARLGYTPYKDSTTVSMPHSSTDLSDMFKDVITKYRAYVSDERINYSASSVEESGNDEDLTFECDTCLEAIERIRQAAGADWWWFVGADNIAHLESKPTSATHQFVFGKDIDELVTDKSVDDVRNNLFLWNGLQSPDGNYLSRDYYNATSESAYWHRWEIKNDSRLTTQSLMDTFADAFIDAYKDPNIGLSFVVHDNNYGDGYDIESVNPGDTCSIVNIDESNVYSNNMLITRVDYSPESIKVYVEDLRTLTSRYLTDVDRLLKDKIYEDGPASYTAVAT